MKQLSAHQFSKVYKDLSIDLDTLGCVMLDVESIAPPALDIELYYAKNKARFWINGWVADETPHITLLYGLLDKDYNWEGHIKTVLSDWVAEEIEIESIGHFDSPYQDEEYYCIVAHIKPTDELLEGHKRLEFLPHVNTFTGYKPHVTLCYIKKDLQKRNELLKALNQKLSGKKLAIKQLNLGDHD